MKTKLKQNSGFAIVYVIFFLFVLSLMGTAMYLYSVTSLRSVRFLSDRKKAEYLAQAGVESAAYAYQLAAGSDNSDISALASSSGYKEDENGNKTSPDISSNTVYMIYVPSAAKDEHYKYVSEDNLPDDSKNIIGYYTVTVTSSVTPSVLNKNYEEKENSYPVEIKESRRTIEATGYVYNSNTNGGKVSAKKKAFLDEPTQALNTYYDDSGIIDGSAKGNTTVKWTDDSGNEKSETVPKSAAKVTVDNKTYDAPFVAMGTYEVGSTLTIKYSMFKNIPLIGKYIGFDREYSFDLTTNNGRPNGEITMFMAYTTGNMIMNKPADASQLTFKENQDNFVSFVGKNNLFVNTGINTKPSKSFFNVMYLRGNTIVINGNVEIYVYGYERKAANLWQSVMTGQGFTGTSQRLTDLKNALNGNYYWSTVVVGTADTETANVYDSATKYVYVSLPKDKSTNDYVSTDDDGNITSSNFPSGSYEKCGKIFFGGNVYVTIQIPNVGSYRYRAFNAGDAYYYDDDLPQTVGGERGYGIDLFKYFVDYSIATKRYSENVLSRLAEVMSMYYSREDGEPTTYVLSKDGVIIYNAMRKIDPNNSYDQYKDLIPPNSADASSLTWVLA